MYVVKAFHVHCVTGDSATHSDASRTHNPGDCYICQFTLSPFTEAEQIQADFILPSVPFEWIFYESKIYKTATCSQSTRAPPVYSVF